MLGEVKTALEVAEKLRTSGERIYYFAAAVASLLTVTTVYAQQRPSEVIARMLRFVGADVVARWFDEQAPPFIAGASVAVQEAVISGMVVTVVVMVAGPLCQGFGDREEIADHALSLVGAPITSTCWLLLAVAAQQGPITAFVQHAASAARSVVGWGVLVLGVLGGLYLLAGRFGLREILGMLLVPLWRLATCIGTVLGVVILAIAFVPAHLPLAALGSMWSLKTGAHRRAEDRARAELEAASPTGAVREPRRS